MKIRISLILMLAAVFAGCADHSADNTLRVKEIILARHRFSIPDSLHGRKSKIDFSTTEGQMILRKVSFDPLFIISIKGSELNCYFNSPDENLHGFFRAGLDNKTIIMINNSLENFNYSQADTTYNGGIQFSEGDNMSTAYEIHPGPQYYLEVNYKNKSRRFFFDHWIEKNKELNSLIKTIQHLSKSARLTKCQVSSLFIVTRDKMLNKFQNDLTITPRQLIIFDPPAK